MHHLKLGKEKIIIPPPPLRAEITKEQLTGIMVIDSNNTVAMIVDEDKADVWLRIITEKTVTSLEQFIEKYLKEKYDAAEVSLTIKPKIAEEHLSVVGMTCGEQKGE